MTVTLGSKTRELSADGVPVLVPRSRLSSLRAHICSGALLRGFRGMDHASSGRVSDPARPCLKVYGRRRCRLRGNTMPVNISTAGSRATLQAQTLRARDCASLVSPKSPSHRVIAHRAILHIAPVDANEPSRQGSTSSALLHASTSFSIVWRLLIQPGILYSHLHLARG